MKKLRITAIVLGFFCIGIAAYAMSCTWERSVSQSNQSKSLGNFAYDQAADPREALVAEARAVLAHADFAALLAEAAVCLDDPDDPIEVPFDLVYDRLKPVESYTRGERMLLCGWRDEKGGHQNLCATFDLLRTYYESHGYLPRDGAELAAWVETGLGKGSIEKLNESLNGPNALSRFGYAINPVTGKCYASFDRDEWHLGGIYFKPDLTFQELEVAFSGRFGFEKCQGADFRGAWLVKVFGDVPGEVLASKPLVMLDASMQPDEKEQWRVREAPPEWKHETPVQDKKRGGR
jgi:hypothetical protein